MDTVRIGLISDTHGLLRPEAMRALQGVERIIHAGDIGNAIILERLATIAPLVAIRGNNDQGSWADVLPAEQMVEAGGARLYVLHDLKELDLNLDSADVQVVISGHSHRPSINAQNGILFVNPGSAGPRRFKLPVSVAFLGITEGNIDAKLEILDI